MSRFVPIERVTTWGTPDPIPHFGCPVAGCESVATDPEATCPAHDFPDWAQPADAGGDEAA